MLMCTRGSRECKSFCVFNTCGGVCPESIPQNSLNFAI